MGPGSTCTQICFVAGIWNSYRATRIKVLLIICDCINALPHPPTGLLEVCPSSTSFARFNIHFLLFPTTGAVGHPTKVVHSYL